MSETSEGTLLGGKVAYRQFCSGHRSGFEPVLLAAAIPARAGDRVLEAGTGAGAGLLCLTARIAGIIGTGVERDADLVQLANENFRNNSLQDVCAVEADISGYRPGAVFDHVFGNPPWHDAAGTASPDKQRALAHRANPDTLTDWIGAMAAALKPKGSLSLILPAAAWAPAGAALANAGLLAITLFPLWPRAGRPAGQIVLQARRRGPAGRLLPGLVMHDGDSLTAAAEAVLRHAAPLW